MKIFLRLPNGTELHFERKQLEQYKFYALTALAAGALFVALFLGIAALR